MISGMVQLISFECQYCKDSRMRLEPCGRVGKNAAFAGGLDMYVCMYLSQCQSTAPAGDWSRCMWETECIAARLGNL